MGEWHKYQPPDPNHPCTNCQVGWGNVSSEMRGSELWLKSDDCHETCQLLKDWQERQELELDIAERG